MVVHGCYYDFDSGFNFGIDGARLLSQEQAQGQTGLLNLAANPGKLALVSKPNKDADYVRLASIYLPALIVERYPVLLKHRLSVFRNWEIASNLK
ncbi:MAG: hypothetical protein WDM76_01860 [Limisphaerales bacterium]